MYMYIYVCINNVERIKCTFYNVCFCHNQGASLFLRSIRNNLLEFGKYKTDFCGSNFSFTLFFRVVNTNKCKMDKETSKSAS